MAIAQRHLAIFQLDSVCTIDLAVQGGQCGCKGFFSGPFVECTFANIPLLKLTGTALHLTYELCVH
jgi:hypothetical protein